MKFLLHVRRYITAILAVPAFTLSSADASLFGLFDKSHTVHVYDADDMEKVNKYYDKVEVILHADINATYKNLDKGLLDLRHLWDDEELYNKLDPVFTGKDGVAYSLTFDGQGKTVGQVVAKGRAEFTGLGNVTICNMVNAELDESHSIYKGIGKVGILTGGAMNCDNGILRNLISNEPAGISMTGNSSVTVDSIYVDLDKAGGRTGSMTGTLGGAFFSHSQGINISSNKHDVAFTNITVAFDRRIDLMPNILFTFGGAIFTSKLNIDDNGGAVRFGNIKTYIDTESLGSDILKPQAGIGSGGALFLTHDSSISGNKGGVSFENCTISNYQVSTGGTIALSFSSNLADIEAGFNEALTLDINNNSSKTGQAAVVFMNNSVTAHKGLMPTTIYGGAVAINRGSTLNLKDNDGILFEGNKVVCADAGKLTHQLIGGGAIFVDTRMDTDLDRGGSTLSITNNNGEVAFISNSSSLLGGAILAHCSAQVDISNNDDVSFTANKAGYSGGAIEVMYYADVNIDGNNSVTFAYNEAMNSEGNALENARGGAISTQGDFSISGNNNVFFSGNCAGAYDEALGGAINLTDTKDGASLNITDNTGNVIFSGNEASSQGTARGGAIYGDANTVINISHNNTVRFDSNSASDEGQAIYTKGKLTIAGNDSVTFSGHERHAIYVSGDSAALEISARKGRSVLFDDDSLYAAGTDVVFNGSSCNGGDIRFTGSRAKAIAHNGDITMGKGYLYLSQSAGLQATSINLQAGATLHATGTGNNVQGKLNMLASTATLALHVGTANRCTGDLETMTLTGSAVMDITGTITGTENFTLAVTLDTLQENGAYKLLTLTGAFSEEQWAAVNVTGDVVRENLLWNRDYTGLYYIHAEEAHAGDRIWTNKAGSGTWNFMARNWMVDIRGELIDGVKYRDTAQTEQVLIPIGVRFTDVCDSPVDVTITDVVSPRDIIVEAARDYTFADGGGKISGTGSLTKNGTGTLTIALNNDFTGDFALNAGTVRAQADGALGKGNFSSEVGSTLVVENKAQVTLNEGDKQTAIKGAVEIARGAALHITPNNVYQAASSKIDGTLRFTNSSSGSGSGAGTLSGSGTIELYNSSSTNGLTIDFAKNEGFNGNISLSGSNSSLIIRDGGYNGSGTISVTGANMLTMNGSTGISLNNGGLLHLQDGAQTTAHDVTIRNGATLKVAGADNRIELQRAQGENPGNANLYFEGGSTLDITLAMVNAIPENGKNIHAALEVNHLAYFNNGGTTATTINVSLSDDMTFGYQYALVHAENGYQYYATEWNENCINVTGDLLFDDLQWIDHDKDGTVDTLILDAPDTVVWTDASGSDVWNTEGDKNWKRFTNRDAAVFRTDDKVLFTDTCTNPAAVRITEAVTPEEILVRAERDYTFADGGGTITGTGELTKEGSGTLTIALANEFSGGVNIREGTVRVLHAGALGSGTLHMGEQGILEVDGDTTLTVNGFYAEGRFIVNKGSTLELTNSKLFATTNCTIDGTLRLTSSDKKINYGTSAISGSGLLSLRGSNNNFVIDDFASSDFTGTLSVEGSGNNLCLDTDDKSSRAHLVVNGSYGSNTLNTITFRDSATEKLQVAHLASGGSLALNSGGMVEAKQVVIGRGAALSVSDSGNIITHEFGPENLNPGALHLLDGSTFNVTLNSANILDAGSWNEAALITNVVPVFGAATATDTAPAAGAQVNLHLTIADYSVLDNDQSYVLMDIRWPGKFNATEDNWNEELINVTGDAIFSDLKWITSSDAGEAAHPNTNSMLVFNAPDAIVWRNSTGSGVWNTEGDKNWKRFTAFEADVFKTGDNIRFTDSCTDGADVSISGAVAPGSILVRAERDYTFTGDGKIIGSGKITKQGSGILSLDMVNESTGGVDLQEGIIRVSNNQALGTGPLNTAKNTLLTVEESATVELTADRGAIRGYVGIIGDSELKITGKSTYAAQATAVVGTLQFAGQSEGGHTDNLRGRGTVLLHTETASRFTIAENKNYTGSLIAQGVANIIEVTSGGYFGDGTLAATADGAALRFAGQDVILERDGVLQTAEGGCISAAAISIGDGATLLAGHTPETGDDSAAVAAIATLSLVEAGTPTAVTIEADKLTLTGGSVYQQNDAYYSLQQVNMLVLDGTNGSDFTLTTNLEAYRHEDSLYYVLFTDVAQDAWSSLGDVNFTITGHNAPTELGYHAESRTLYLKTSEAVPEPTTATLSLLALAALAARRRRR